MQTKPTQRLAWQQSDVSTHGSSVWLHRHASGSDTAPKQPRLQHSSALFRSHEPPNRLQAGRVPNTSLDVSCPGGHTDAATHLPPWHVPPRQAVPLGLVFLHLPCLLRFLHGAHGFFYLAAASSPHEAPSRLRAAARAAAKVRRREPTRLRDRARRSKWTASIAGTSEVA